MSHECKDCAGSKVLALNVSEELRKRCLSVEVSEGVMRQVLLLSDVEEIVAKLIYSSAVGA